MWPVPVELKTIRDFVRWGMSRCYQAGVHLGHGADSLWDESLFLVLHAVHLPWDVDPHVLDAQLTAEEHRRIVDLFAARVEQRVPAAYLTHESWFADMPFYVDERVLIPRSPIAELIREQFHPWVLPEQVEQILELGTGSGCIALACAMHLPDAQVIASDISPDALAVAKRNRARHHLEHRVRLLESDLFAEIDGRYDIIVSNPPYVGDEEFQALPAEYEHEPASALLADEQGLSIVYRILHEAEHYLTEQGILIVEVGNSEDALIEAFPEVPFHWLDFQHGGHGVFLLTAEQLREHRAAFEARKS